MCGLARAGARPKLGAFAAAALLGALLSGCSSISGPAAGDPALTSPAPGSTLAGSSAVFAWKADIAASSYQLLVGTKGANSSDIGVYPVSAGAAATMSVAVSGIPTKGQPLYVALVWMANGKQSAANYTYLEAQTSQSLPALQSITCASNSFTGAGSDTCEATLNGPAGAGATTVALSSDSAALTVPATVTVAAGASSATFQAAIAAVTAVQTATITASADGTAATFAISLAPAPAGSATLSVNSPAINFGSVPLNTPATQTLQLKSTGTQPVTVTSATLTGAGFSLSGASFPIILQPDQSTDLSLVFNPAAAGSATGQLTLASNSSTGAATVVKLAGTGVENTVAYKAELTWSAPTDSTVSISGYRIYRAFHGASIYVLLNGTTDDGVSYADSTVVSGADYDYYVETVDTDGVSSAPSNVVTLAIP